MTHHNKTTMSALKAAATHLQRKDAGDPFAILSKKFGDMTDATLERIGESDQKLAEVQERVVMMDQKLARNESWGGGVTRPETWGSQFVRGCGDDIQTLSENSKGSVSLNLKALTGAPDSAGSMDVPHRDPAAALMPRQRLTIRDLMQVVSISSGTVEYVQQNTQPDGATPVAEGALKPESEMDFELKTVAAKTIAHWIKASRQVLEDAPQLKDLIDTEMRNGLALVEENQILNGDGTGQNLLGLIPSATAFAAPITIADPTMLDTIGTAILQNALADFPADGIVMHPSDWTRLRLLKDDQGRYLLGAPGAEVEPRLFGLPVVPTKAIGVDEFLVGSFAEAGTLYDRWQPRVEVGYVDKDFVMNLVTILAESRVALAVKQGKALTHGEFGNV